jgi:uncharacterized protein
MRTLLITFLITVIYGCETTNVQPEVPSTPDQQALELYQEGKFLLAGQEYIRLSDEFPADATDYKLKAVNSYIQARNFENASEILNSITTSQTQEFKNNFHSILKAKIELENENPELTLKITQNINPGTLAPDIVELLLETRAIAFEQSGLSYRAAKELITLDNIRIDIDQPPAYSIEIWKYLISENLDEIGDLGNLSENFLVAWIELINITKSLITQSLQFRETIDVWRQLNPSHPANTELIPELLLVSDNFNSTPDQIALLLPLTGIYERYSEKIREGFLTAWFNESSYKPKIKIYNTNNNDILKIYNQAVSDGADFIVGPLDKEAVQKISAMENIPVRTLALNQIDISTNTHTLDKIVPLHNFVQFGLPPEDEARQVAQRGIFEGYNRALVVTSNDEFGHRVFNAFHDEWTAMGGNVLEKVEYDLRTTDFVTPIKQLLNINSSEQRFTNLRQRLSRNLVYNSRLREDAEFIFVVGTNLTARQVVPHLRFFRAEGIPIYSISSVYSGNENPQTDSDLNGVEFVDIPWLLRGDIEPSSLASQIRDNWDTDSTVFPRYYAFGVDAFRLISNIGDLMLKTSNKYLGETGHLYLTVEGKIRRNLIWAKFDKGIPVPLSTGNTH